MDASERPNILWGLTGSVATIRADRLAEQFLTLGAVRAVVTRRARHFLPPLPAEIELFDDASEWDLWRELGDPVVHIELRKWADVFVVSPITADAMAKMSVGICDTLLLSIARAWDFTKPLVVAPAMNTMMWEHPTTLQHLATLQEWGVTVVDPVEKTLACADVGVGALAPAETIRAAVAAALARQR